MSKTEEGEDTPPYFPYSFIEHPYYSGVWWSYRHNNYQGVYAYRGFVPGKDELHAFINACKHLNKLKEKADKRRQNKEQTNEYL